MGDTEEQVKRIIRDTVDEYLEVRDAVKLYWLTERLYNRLWEHLKEDE